MQRRGIRLSGTVQGVGFRPFVYRTAVALGLTGLVRNDAHGVWVEAQGPQHALDELWRQLHADAPPLAHITHASHTPLQLVPGEDAFRIVATSDGGGAAADISIDVAPCAQCLIEMSDPADRRHAYPFINCTNCGPRYTIITGLPYDRVRTTMAAFQMCQACRAEYDDPGDRRFHAQPNACPECGPTLVLDELHEEAALRAAVGRLLAGEVVAVKGVGGYHVAVDATNDAAVVRLRLRKQRGDKPFALMVATVDDALRLVLLDNAAQAALVSPRRPIVLAPRRPGADVAPAVAPGLLELGVMLPSSPLHQLLLAHAARPLVMTSGNRSDEPIAHTDADARERLGTIADAFLAHDRPIHVRCDDSVVRLTEAGVQMVRRSRGYAPEPLPLPVPTDRHLLAVGAELKNTVAVTRHGQVIASQHIGDLEQAATYSAFLDTIAHLCHVFGITPELVAHDLHPEYLSTKFALQLDLPLLGVQHHHAHIAACLAEHGHTGRVLGVAFDGLGYGTDGTLWGGEFLVADLRTFERVASLAPVPLPGGAAAVREPWRMAVAWTAAATDAETLAREGARLDPRWAAVAAVGAHSPVTSSAGRLFDAAAALLGVRKVNTYEAQAAIELEALARRACGPIPRLPMACDDTVLDPAPLLRALLEARDQGIEPANVAAAFHSGLADGTAELVSRLAARHELDTVALSGGVFQNAYLTRLLVDRLRPTGIRVLVHEHLPPNDGAISVGQAAVAAATVGGEVSASAARAARG